MFSVRYAGNWVMSVVFALIAAASFGLPAVAQATGATVFLGQLVAAFAVAGVLVLVINAALKRAPLFDWSTPCGTRLHPRAKSALQTLGVTLVALLGLLGYISIFVFGLYGILYFGLFMVVVMMSWILYVTAGKHLD
jgi:hypothetical protein